MLWLRRRIVDVWISITTMTPRRHTPSFISALFYNRNKHLLHQQRLWNTKLSSSSTKGFYTTTSQQQEHHHHNLSRWWRRWFYHISLLNNVSSIGCLMFVLLIVTTNIIVMISILHIANIPDQQNTILSFVYPSNTMNYHVAPQQDNLWSPWSSIDDRKLMIDRYEHDTTMHIFPITVQMQSQWNMPFLNNTNERHSQDITVPKQIHILDHSNDFGGIILLSSSRNTYGITIRDNDNEIHDVYRMNLLEQMDKPYVSYYYLQYDDLDFTSLNDINSVVPFVEDDPASCERPKWGYQSHPNCNTVHELQPLNIPNALTKYLSHGAFRDAWSMVDEITNNKHNQSHSSIDPIDVVVKRLRYVLPQDIQKQYEIRMEATFMDITTASNVIGNIYGHCSTSIIVESAHEFTYNIVPHHMKYQKYRGRISNEIIDKLQKQYTQTKWVNSNHNSSISHRPTISFSFNSLTSVEKLSYAIQMAEGIAEMHGYVGGVIVHDDIHPDQWVLSKQHKNRIILNDMNNAVVMEWSRMEQSYCPYWDLYGGDYRAPEVFLPNGSMVNETSDIWPMGNLIYSLITGLFPYYNLTDETSIQQITISGVRPYFPNDMEFRQECKQHNFILHRLIQIMDLCHTYDAKQRPTIFTIYQMLLETQQMYDQNRTYQDHQYHENPWDILNSVSKNKNIMEE